MRSSGCIYSDPEGIMVICAYDEQIEYLATLTSFEVDMSYKRIKGDVNEVVFSTMIRAHGKIMTLLRVFTDQDSKEGYARLFFRVFTLVSEVTGRPFQFHYLHGAGLKTIVVDMDTKQFTGLGIYLQSVDPQHRDWRVQIQHILIYCRVHFYRLIAKLLVDSDYDHYDVEIAMMKGLPRCRSSGEYYDDLDTIAAANPRFVGWVQHKKIPFIASGLCRSLSPIQPEFFSEAAASTNSAEQTHMKSYHRGIREPLLKAIKASEVIDQTDVTQFTLREKNQQRHSYRADDELARAKGHYTKNARERLIRTILPQLPDILTDMLQAPNLELTEEERVLLEADSSGGVRQTRSRSRSARARGRATTPRAQSSQARSSPARSSLARSSPVPIRSPRPSNLQRATVNYHYTQRGIEDAEFDRHERELRIRESEARLQLVELQVEEARLRVEQARQASTNERV